MGPDDPTRERLRVLVLAAFVVLGVALTAYGAYGFYLDATSSPYTHVALEVEAGDVEGSGLEMVEFDDLAPPEQEAFLEMVEHDGEGGGLGSDSPFPPVAADVVAYVGSYYEVRLGEVRADAPFARFASLALVAVGMVMAAVGLRELRGGVVPEKDEDRPE